MTDTAVLLKVRKYVTSIGTLAECNHLKVKIKLNNSRTAASYLLAKVSPGRSVAINTHTTQQANEFYRLKFH